MVPGRWQDLSNGGCSVGREAPDVHVAEGSSGLLLPLFEGESQSRLLGFGRN